MSMTIQITSSRGTTTATLSAIGQPGIGADGSVWACDPDDGRYYTADLVNGGHVYATNVTVISGDFGTVAADDAPTTTS